MSKESQCPDCDADRSALAGENVAQTAERLAQLTTADPTWMDEPRPGEMVDSVPYAVVPDGCAIQVLEHLLPHPMRICQRADLTAVKAKIRRAT